VCTRRVPPTGGLSVFGVLGVNSKCKRYPYPMEDASSNSICAEAALLTSYEALNVCPASSNTCFQVVAHVAQLRTGFRITFARTQRTIRHLDFRTPKLRTRRSGVRTPPGAPFFLFCFQLSSTPVVWFSFSNLGATGSKTRATLPANSFCASGIGCVYTDSVSRESV
jgi:hypothetical protein